MRSRSVSNGGKADRGLMVWFGLVKALIHPSYHKECMSVAFNNSNIDINFL